MKLIIVESPTKARTLSRFLGNDFNIVSSVGHIRDLPKSRLGVDIEKDFRPEYVIIKGKRKVIAALKKQIAKAGEVYLATDLDREGEAIGWHIIEAVGWPKGKNRKPGIKESDIKRIVFHEITKEAILEAMSHPRGIDMNLVDAQQARRILDRLVGYKLSPLLWEKVRYGLSAGRVQSVAVRLIVDREKEREEFVPEEYWSIEAELAKIRVPNEKFVASLLKRKGEKVEVKNEEEARRIIGSLKNVSYIVTDVNHLEKRRNPLPPFTTSTLQQSAVNILGFNAKRTMRAAQNLYEAGFITYMRTDSVYLSFQAVRQTRDYIKKELGERYLPEKEVRYKSKTRRAQEAHEAIRPTDIYRLAALSEIQELGRDESKLYDLIWRRMVTCQMKPAILDQITVDITAGDFVFRATGLVIKFDGFLKLEKKDMEKYLPELEVGEELKLLQVTPFQHFTQPPPRYTEATLIRELEKSGIGRPSTYAPIIETIQGRGYVDKAGKYFFPLDVGKIVSTLLKEHFPKIVDVKFTALLEDDLDEIAKGVKDSKKVLKEFYEPFAERLAQKSETLKKEDFTLISETEERCPECGRQLVVKLGRYGKFLSCSGFPECKHRSPFVEGEEEQAGKVRNQVDKSQLGERCPKCGAEVVLKEGRFGKFIACKNYPECKYTKNYLDKIGMKCPICGEGEVIRKKTRRGKNFYGCSTFPKCKFASWVNPKGTSGL